MTTPRFISPRTGYRDSESLHWKEMVEAIVIGAGAFIGLWLWFAL